MDDALHRELLTAHQMRDLPGLVTLYAQAAETSDDIDEMCFFLTHAYIFALDAGDARAANLRARLVAAGRET